MKKKSSSLVKIKASIGAKIMRKAVEKDIIPSLSYFKRKYNYIDLYGFLTEDQKKMCNKDEMPIPQLSDKDREFRDSSIYSVLPLYEEQLIRVNKYCYKYVEFKMLDFENETIKEFRDKSDLVFHIIVEGFSMIVIDGIRQWTFDSGASYVVSLRDRKDENSEPTIAVAPIPESFVDGYQFVTERLSIDSVGLTDKELFVLTGTSFLDSINLMKDPEQAYKLGESELGSILMYMVQLNRMLIDNKAKAIRGSGKKANVTYDKSIKGKPKRKLTRLVDGRIRITSEKPPHAFEGRKQIQYKVAKWSRRGYMRQYKSGKKVYVQPATCHRKALVDIEDKQETRKTDLIVQRQTPVE